MVGNLRVSMKPRWKILASIKPRGINNMAAYKMLSRYEEIRQREHDQTHL